MRVALLAASIVAIGAGCGNSSDPPSSQGSSGSGVVASGDIVKGTLSIGGTAIAASELQCRPGAAVHIFIDIVTPKGTLHVEDGTLALDGEPLTCEKFDRSWGGGRRPNNAAPARSLAYWRGTLSFTCVRGAQRVDGDLELDCGGITAEERASLDANRKRTREQQKAGSAN